MNLVDKQLIDRQEKKIEELEIFYKAARDVAILNQLDASRYKFLKKILKFRLGGYKCESGRPVDATESSWYLESESECFEHVGCEPPDIDEAIDRLLTQSDL